MWGKSIKWPDMRQIRSDQVLQAKRRPLKEIEFANCGWHAAGSSHWRSSSTRSALNQYSQSAEEASCGWRIAHVRGLLRSHPDPAAKLLGVGVCICRLLIISREDRRGNGEHVVVIVIRIIESRKSRNFQSRGRGRAPLYGAIVCITGVENKPRGMLCNLRS